MRFPVMYLRLIILLVTVFYFTIECSPVDDYCDRRHGQTILKGRVLDFYTKKPIDSVRIKIVWNSSWDPFIDTIVKQNDSLSFTFDAFDDCEPFYYKLSSKHYWVDYEQDYEHHPVYNVSIDKGEMNNFEAHLKPATFFKMNVRRDTLKNPPDRVFFLIKRANTEDWETWGTVYPDDSAYYDVESYVDYDVCWTSSVRLDTSFYHFTAKPFDTVRLDYR